MLLLSPGSPKEFPRHESVHAPARRLLPRASFLLCTTPQHFPASASATAPPPARVTCHPTSEAPPSLSHFAFPPENPRTTPHRHCCKSQLHSPHLFDS